MFHDPPKWVLSLRWDVSRSPTKFHGNPPHRRISGRGNVPKPPFLSGTIVVSMSCTAVRMYTVHVCNVHVYGRTVQCTVRSSSQAALTSVGYWYAYRYMYRVEPVLGTRLTWIPPRSSGAFMRHTTGADHSTSGVEQCQLCHQCVVIQYSRTDVYCTCM